MPPKQKGNGYLEEILKMKRKRNDEAAECGESSNDLPRPSENVFFHSIGGRCIRLMGRRCFWGGCPAWTGSAIL